MKNKLGKWLLSGLQDKLNRAENCAEYWRNEFEKADRAIGELGLKIMEQKKLIQSQEQRISELEDEINVQKDKAAKYLSYCLTKMEKYIPDD
jgi:chromosome segregation ATPase